MWNIGGSLVLGALAAVAYPVTYTSCGVTHTVNASPERVVTMNQGATEFLFALGLADKMAGTAYLDDFIWPQYAQDYAGIPVLSSSYPNEATLMGVNPDFVVASYSSAFLEQYEHPTRGTRGIFTNATVGPCVGEGSEWGETWRTCRPQLHDDGIGTYLLGDACENRDLRPESVSETTVYDEMRSLGKIFGVNVEDLINDMQKDFQNAEAAVSSAMHGSPLKAVWLDCVGRCCKVEAGQEPQVYVGAGNGAPAMLMQEAGLSNVFSDRTGNWACVNESDIATAEPDVIIVVDAAWDKAIDKIKYLYNHCAFCGMAAVRGARFVSIPFSASTLSPRNGPAALDLAIASLHVRLGSMTSTGKSGVGSFNPYTLQAQTKDSKCPLAMESVVYDVDGGNDGDGNDGDGNDGDGNDGDDGNGCYTTTPTVEESNALALGLGWSIGIPAAMLVLGAGAWF